MERLTKRDENGTAFIVLDEDSKEWSVSVDKPSYTHTIECEAVDKLAEYEDAEEQGLLLRLPCKVGTPIYKVVYSSRINDGFIYETTMSLKYYADDINAFKNGLVYLTREEAEQKLESMQKGENNGKES